METQYRNSYQVRKAAGLYWILKMDQIGQAYVEPLPVNQVGADIFGLLQEGNTSQDIARKPSLKYGAPEEVIEEDVLAFLEQLKERGFN